MSTIKPADFARINQSLIDLRLLSSDAVPDLESFGPASRVAYADYLSQNGVPVTAPSGTLVPEHIKDVPAALLGNDDADEEEVEEVTDSETDETETETETEEEEDEAEVEEEADEETEEETSEEDEPADEETEEESDEEEDDEA